MKGKSSFISVFLWFVFGILIKLCILVYTLKYKVNDFALWVNGFEVATDNSGTTPSGLNKLEFTDSFSNNFYGNAKQLQYFDTALNDNELEQISSWVSFQDMAEGQLYTIE